MELYQCIKQPKGFDENFERRIFKKLYTEYVCLTSNPPQEKTYIKLYCDDTNLNIQIEEEEFNNCFVKFEQPILLRTGGIGIPTVEIIEEKKEMNKTQRHKELCEELNTVYKQKNEKYGDSFGISVKKYGLIAALTRISDKFNRFEQLILTRSDGTTDESLIDTCLDAANYFLMTAMELENQPKQKKSYVKPEMEIKHASYEDLEEMFKQSI